MLVCPAQGTGWNSGFGDFDFSPLRSISVSSRRDLYHCFISLPVFRVRYERGQEPVHGR